MTATVSGAAVLGIDGHLVDVTVDVRSGLPGIDIEGLPASQIREARYRVRSALAASGYRWPEHRVLAALEPLQLPKHGTGLDLPLAVAMLIHLGVVTVDQVDGITFFGELALDGGIRSTGGAVSAALAAAAAAQRSFFTGSNDASQAAAAGISSFGFGTLAGMVAALNGGLAVASPPSPPRPDDGAVNLRFVRGQPKARRAIEIAAVGGHGLLMVGPPGCGKTLLARAMLGLLPPLLPSEQLEVMQIRSVARLLKGGPSRPFRAPHSTVSSAALCGGGNPPRPGELSLAHHGVLFLDDLPEFGRQALDLLRTGLEDGFLDVTRDGYSARLPAKAVLVGAMQSCFCGRLGAAGSCSCPPDRLASYWRRITPLRSRFELCVELEAVTAGELAAVPNGEPSEAVRARVAAAVERRERRGEGVSAQQLPSVERVARSIADLAGSDAVLPEHLEEAMSYQQFPGGSPQ